MIGRVLRAPFAARTWREFGYVLSGTVLGAPPFLEREILGLLAEGRSNVAIASDLHLAGRSVEKHVTAIFGKLDLPPAKTDHRRVLAVLRYLKDRPQSLPDAAR